MKLVNCEMNRRLHHQMEWYFHAYCKKCWGSAIAHSDWILDLLAGLTASLKNPDAVITVAVPTDAAFKALVTKRLDMQNKVAVQEVTYHFPVHRLHCTVRTSSSEAKQLTNIPDAHIRCQMYVGKVHRCCCMAFFPVSSSHHQWHQALAALSFLRSTFAASHITIR